MDIMMAKCKELSIFWIFLKSFFVCQHFPSDLKIKVLLEKITECKDFEEWNCTCVCKCGEEVEQKFALCKYLGPIPSRYTIKS